MSILHCSVFIEGIPTSEFINVWAKREDSDPKKGSLPYEETSSVTPSMNVFWGRKKDGNSSLRSENRSEDLSKSPTHNIYCIPQPGEFVIAKCVRKRFKKILTQI